jgi:hypothetical protein
MNITQTQKTLFRLEKEKGRNGDEERKIGFRKKPFMKYDDTSVKINELNIELITFSFLSLCLTAYLMISNFSLLIPFIADFLYFILYNTSQNSQLFRSYTYIITYIIYTQTYKQKF